MRLIDSDALKEEVNKKKVVGRFNTLLLIDNAPTVPQDCSDCKRFDFPYFVVKFDKEQMQELVNKAKVEVLASIERPQGKWAEIEGGYICSNCEDIEAYTPNFCPNCGADMRGDKKC